MKDSDAPEFETVETFVEFLLDDERTSFTLGEAAKVAARTGTSNRAAIDALVGYGLTYDAPGVARRVRGYTTSSNDRYFGPGSERMHGGSGYEQVTGFAGQEG